MLLLVENLFKKNPLQDFLSSLNAVISTNESTQFITGHVIYNPAYTYKFQLKTTVGSKQGGNVLSGMSIKHLRVLNGPITAHIEQKKLKWFQTFLWYSSK